MKPMKWKTRKSNLDEQQERRLLEIESRGCWLAFWGLLAALAVETLIGDVGTVTGEWIIFMTLALYLAFSCMRAGIWDRRLELSRKTCLLAALIAGLCAGAFVFGVAFLRSGMPVGSLYAGAMAGVFSFVVCSIILLLAARAVRKRQEELNAEPEEETQSPTGL